jgi:phage shock protein C
MNDFASQPADEVPSGEQPAADQPSAGQPSADQPSAGQAPKDGAGGSPSGASTFPQFGYQPRSSDYEALYRPASGRMIAGVAAGIAQYLGVDVTIVRIALAVLTVVGGAGIPVYAAGWLLIPDEESDQSIASELIGSLQSRTN